MIRRVLPLILIAALSLAWRPGAWNQKDKILIATDDSSSISADTTLSMGGSDAEEVVTPVDMTCTTLAVQVDVAPSAGQKWDIYLRDDGANTNIVCTISGTSTTCNTSSTAVFIAAGSIIGLNFDETGTATATSGESATLVCEI